MYIIVAILSMLMIHIFLRYTTYDKIKKAHQKGKIGNIAAILDCYCLYAATVLIPSGIVIEYGRHLGYYQFGFPLICILCIWLVENVVFSFMFWNAEVYHEIINNKFMSWISFVVAGIILYFMGGNYGN